MRSEGAADRVRRSVDSDSEVAARNGSAGRLEVATGDLGDWASLLDAASGCGLVFHLAGVYRGSAADMQAVNVDGTARLLAALDPGARLVMVSSTSVYGWGQDWPADHRSPPHPESAYGRSKLAAEHLAQTRTDGSVVVVRPTITYGPGDTEGMLPRVAHLMSRRIRRFPGTGANRVHLVHVDDLVAGLLLAGERGDGVFVLGGGEATPFAQVLALLAGGAGLPAPSFGVPAGVLRPVARGVEAAWAAIHLPGEPLLSTHSVDVATRDRCYSWSRAAAELGWAPKVPVEVGVPATGRWLAGRSGHDTADETRGDMAKRNGRGSDDGAAGKAGGSGKAGRTVPGFEPGRPAGEAAALGFDWRGYVEDPDEGLGTVYERFALRDVLDSAVAQTGATSVLHAPLFGMMGFPGLDAVFLARRGVRVGLLDIDAERLEAVRAQWAELGLEPETHLVDGPDARTWPATLSEQYDLVFSFAALWWFDDPWAVLAAQARWAEKGVLSCVPNRNVFMRMRARLWHKDLFERLNEEALDAGAQSTAAAGLGLRSVGTGLFDIPPFPDTSVPLAKVVRALIPSRRKAVAAVPAERGEADEGAWAWSILPHLKGDDDDMEARIARLTVLERHLPATIAPALAHHRYTLFVPATLGKEGAEATQTS